jgi:hypothetical protein
LPALPAKLTSSGLIEALAMERRVDLGLARTNLEIFAKTLGLTHATRYINASALGPLREYETTVTDGQTPERFDRYGRSNHVRNTDI